MAEIEHSAFQTQFEHSRSITNQGIYTIRSTRVIKSPEYARISLARYQTTGFIYFWIRDRSQFFTMINVRTSLLFHSGLKFEINVLTCMYKLLQDKHMRHFLKFILIFALAAPSELLNDKKNFKKCLTFIQHFPIIYILVHYFFHLQPTIWRLMISLRPKLKSNGLVSAAFNRNNVKICTKITTTILLTY